MPRIAKATDTDTRKVDDRGRVTLPAEFAGSHVRFIQEADGRYRIEKMVLVAEPTAWFWQNPNAQELVAAGLADIQAGRVSSFDPRDEDLEGLDLGAEE